MVKAILIKPLDGDAEGTVRELNKADFDRLKAKGAVRAIGDEPKASPAARNKKAPTVKNKAAV